jgi:hypothetical protein
VDVVTALDGKDAPIAAGDGWDPVVLCIDGVNLATGTNEVRCASAVSRIVCLHASVSCRRGIAIARVRPADDGSNPAARSSPACPGTRPQWTIGCWGALRNVSASLVMPDTWLRVLIGNQLITSDELLRCQDSSTQPTAAAAYDYEP